MLAVSRKLEASNSLCIRPARTTDIPELARLRVESWRRAYHDIIEPDVLAQMHTSSSGARLRQGIEHPRPGERLLVAEITHPTRKLAGYAWVGVQARESLPYSGEIFELYLAPAQQRQGIGRQLLTRAIWTLVELGLNPVMVWVLTRNPARSFYPSCGGIELIQGTVMFGRQRLTRVAYGWGHLLPLPL